jgi:hypothetical protein
MVWDQPAGEGVDAVRTALQNLETGDGSCDDVKAAVSTAKFAVRPTALSLDELGANWEYQPMPDTITDSVQVALFTKVITMAQYQELMSIAQFTGPAPSRSQT